MSRQQEPLVSVVTPVYNGAKYLRECLASLIAQSYANWRCALVNNRSTDDSLEIALHYASLDSRITVHNNAEFLPIIDNLNRAYALIDRDCIYCKPLMADDWLYPECIATMVSCALAQPSIGDRKSTRLNSSHSQISYAVFCLKKKTMRRLPWPPGQLGEGRSSGALPDHHPGAVSAPAVSGSLSTTRYARISATSSHPPFRCSP